MTTAVPDIALALGEALSQRIGESRYQLWFADKTTLSWSGAELVVGVPNHFYQDWLQQSFVEPLRQAAAEVLGDAPPLRFVIDPRLFQEFRQRESEVERKPEPKQATATRTPAVRGVERARPWKRLEDFVVGPCNRVAHAAARALIEDAGHGPNILVLHGPVGTGKTHLLEGVRHGLAQASGERRIVYFSAEEFTNRFVQAMYHGRLPALRKQFRECDALLIDDVHFFARKKATQEEFLHTFDSLQADGRPIMVTCDAHPRLIDTLLPELADRLLGGSIWSLALPDEQTRIELLRVKCRQPGRPALPEDVLRLLAEQLRGNVRELEGALYSLLHYGKVEGRPIDRAMAREALKEVLRHSVRLVQPADVERAVCAALGLEATILQSKQRGWTVSHPRMLAMHLARKHTAATYAEIGQRFGGRNHSTAVAAEKKVKQWLADGAVLQLGPRAVPVRELIERVERELLR